MAPPAYAWFVLLLATAVIVATGVKLYGKLGKFEVSSEEKPEHTVASDHQ
jgi:hypothetical protein